MFELAKSYLAGRIYMKVLLITPPFTQLNTPYPATAYIKGYLKTVGVSATQVDLGIEVILDLFSSAGLTRLFGSLPEEDLVASANAARIYALRERYLSTIDSVITFLQNKDETLAYLISEQQFLPQASRFEQLEELSWAFGSMGIRDKARHLATLYLEDLSDFIVELVDPHFGFSRYAERLGMSANSFDELDEALHQPDSLITTLSIERLQLHIDKAKPDLICLSVPFPGNLFSALKCGQFIKKNFPATKVAMGGGYPNTELRSVRDVRVFEYVDFISLDDGEQPLTCLIQHLEGQRELSMLKRTFALIDGQVTYCNGAIEADVKQEKVGTPDYSDLDTRAYLSVIQLTNPMHRLWSDGRWNKLTMAHGCYWGKCTFCDISLDYIKNYESSSAKLLADRMEELIEQTGERGFHFVDEAAPPALMKELALEIITRNLVVTWWTNIRFEKSFSYDICRLLAASGCVAVSGGLEVASDRLLQLIAKGVTVEQVTRVNDNFTRAGVMVHAYLMYGFPTQTAQETVDSLEVVRQMFVAGVLQSAFWHRFAMTAHSPVGMYPDKFSVSKANATIGRFANNDLEHLDPTGADHELFSDGLKKSLFNYMHGVCLDHPLQNWFDHRVPQTTHPADMIDQFLATPNSKEPRPQHRLVWVGGPVSQIELDELRVCLNIESNTETYRITTTKEIGEWLVDLLHNTGLVINEAYRYNQAKANYEAKGLTDFTLFWYGPEMEKLKKIGLLVV